MPRLHLQLNYGSFRRECLSAVPIEHLFLSRSSYEAVRLHTALRPRHLVPDWPCPMHPVRSRNFQPKQGLHQRVPVHPLRCRSILYSQWTKLVHRLPCRYMEQQSWRTVCFYLRVMSRRDVQFCTRFFEFEGLS